MKTKDAITVLIGGFITVMPQLLTMIPIQYRDIATGLFGVGVSMWHLYTPTPTQGQKSA